MPTLLITVVDLGRRGYQVALTDRQIVARRRRCRTATVACVLVYRLMRRGHRLAFPGALRALEADARAELDAATPAPLGQAAD